MVDLFTKKKKKEKEKRRRRIMAYLTLLTNKSKRNLGISSHKKKEILEKYFPGPPHFHVSKLIH